MITAVQKQKHTEEEYSRKVHELESEIASSGETQEALERKVREIFFFFFFGEFVSVLRYVDESVN